METYNRANKPTGYTYKQTLLNFKNQPKIIAPKYLLSLASLNHGNLPSYRKNISSVMFCLENSGVDDG